MYAYFDVSVSEADKSSLHIRQAFPCAFIDECIIQVFRYSRGSQNRIFDLLSHFFHFFFHEETRMKAMKNGLNVVMSSLKMEMRNAMNSHSSNDGTPS